MLYRRIGKTGINASVVGLGCEHLDGKPYARVKETIDAALQSGVNILDVFMPGQAVRENIFKALGDRRKDVIIQGHIGSTDVRQQYDISRDMKTVKRYFEALLRLAGGHIELGMMFFIDSKKDYESVFETPFISHVQQLKQQGDIGHIGFSSHNPETAAMVIQTGVPEMMLFSINPAFDMLPSDTYALDALGKGLDHNLMRGIDLKRAALYTLCEQKQIGITVMKTLGAGKLLSKEHTPFAGPMTIWQCIHYALSRPGVASALIGCQSAEEMLEAAKYCAASEAERDYAPILGTLRNDFKGRCVYCSHCQPCPVGIDIATVNKYLDIALLDEANVPPSIRSHYQGLPNTGGACIACGNCESRCPFDVKIIENMKRADELLASRQ